MNEKYDEELEQVFQLCETFQICFIQYSQLFFYLRSESNVGGFYVLWGQLSLLGPGDDWDLSFWNEMTKKNNKSGRGWIKFYHDRNEP